MSGLVQPETMSEHRARWFVYAGGERIPHQKTMRGTWGYDVVCSCGWDSHTGGATRGSVQRDLDDHRWDAQFEQQLADDMRAAGLDPNSIDDKLRYLRSRLEA